MGMKKRMAAPKQTLEHCEVKLGIVMSWEHCQCSKCIAKQMVVLRRRLFEAHDREGSAVQFMVGGPRGNAGLMKPRRPRGR